MEKQVQEDINEFQTTQNKLQLAILQKQQIQGEIEEIENATKELKKSTGAIFKLTGSLFLECSKEEAESELNEKKETLVVRLNILQRQEEKLKSRLIELRAKLEGVLGAG